MKIAFIIPAYNEEGAIGRTIDNAKKIIPSSDIYVCDNNSTDCTKEEARSHGATVLNENRKGKGYAVRKLFSNVNADVYIMVDGDNTYCLDYLKDAVDFFIANDLDLMTGNRFSKEFKSHMRKGHKIGNMIFSLILKKICQVKTSDVFSGLRIISKRFINCFPLVSSEFELESELSVFASKMKVNTDEFPTCVTSRVGTKSKLNTYKDGLKILFFILKLLHREYPLRLYLPFSLLISSISIYFLFNIYVAFIKTGLVLKLPTMIAACFGLITGLVSIGIGLILKELVNSKYEGRYMSYIASSRKN